MSYHGRLFLVLTLFYALDLYALTPHIRVRIAKNLRTIKVSGMDLKSTINGETDPRIYGGQKVIKFRCDNLSKPFTKDSILLATVESPTDYISWGKKRYRGKLLIATGVKKNRCDLILMSSMEEYLSTLLAKEMSSGWPLEALKAQAIAARSYALHKIRTKQFQRKLKRKIHFDIENSEVHQVSGTFYDQTFHTYKAAIETKGIVLKNFKKVIEPIFYFSKCGGKTFIPSHIWDNSLPTYKAVKCQYCHPHGKSEWSYKLSFNKMKTIIKNALQKLNAKSKFKEKIIVANDRIGAPYLRVYHEGEPYKVKKALLRRFLGRNKMPSNNFKISNNADHILITGKGNGHGVGMCQFGAYEMASRGWSYDKILTYYYPAHELSKIY